MHRLAVSCLVLASLACGAATVHAQTAPAAGRQRLDEYFRAETQRLRDASLTTYASEADWTRARDRLREELQYMLGLTPWPARSPLQAVVTGVRERDGVIVENLHFQSMPGLYVTANLYRPAQAEGPLPAVLYVCGHGGVKHDGVSYGNKVHYQHHGAWFARNGYVCLTIDSLQLGEIEAIHHGTYRYDRWWWLNRGYTPAGVEAWNCLRSLDYLQSRKEVDPQRLGVTGRSGGGAYSWWITALDERVRAAVPVAGITDLENHVVDGCVEGHCDCMYLVNAYRWDYPVVAALAAPRPLLISNSDRDRIFPLEGVLRTHAYVRSIYRLLDAESNVALQITAGGHQDTQELRVHAFRWLNQHLRGVDELIESVARPLFGKEELRVLEQLPEDERNTSIDETFVARAPEPVVPPSVEAWRLQAEQWRRRLRGETFGGWPDDDRPAAVRTVATVGSWDSASVERPYLAVLEVAVQSPWELPVVVVSACGDPRSARAIVADDAVWTERLRRLATSPQLAEPLRQLAAAADREAGGGDPAAPQDWREALQAWAERGEAVVLIPPRGVGPTAWAAESRDQVQIRRRFHLLGQTLDGMRVWDVSRCLPVLRQRYPSVDRWELEGQGAMSGIALYASLFCSPAAVRLPGYPEDSRKGPVLLNVDRILHPPQALALVAAGCDVTLPGGNPAAWEYAHGVLQLLNRPQALQYPPGPGGDFAARPAPPTDQPEHP